MEAWSPIKGYEGYYEVSNLGRVKALERDVPKSNGVIQHRKERIKTPTINPDGYMVVGLCKDTKQIKRPVHRLVADAFIPGWFDGAEVNHKDFDRKNNCAENLEWVSHQDNILYSYGNGRMDERFSMMRGSTNPNYGNHKLRDRYASDPTLAKEKQSRPGEQNGRAKPVTVLFPDGRCITFPFMVACARYLIDNHYTSANDITGVSAHISEAAKTGKPYLGVRFEFN